MFKCDVGAVGGESRFPVLFPDALTLTSLSEGGSNSTLLQAHLHTIETRWSYPK